MTTGEGVGCSWAAWPDMPMSHGHGPAPCPSRTVIGVDATGIHGWAATADDETETDTAASMRMRERFAHFQSVSREGLSLSLACQPALVGIKGLPSSRV
jgi:hypothetical protein